MKTGVCHHEGRVEIAAYSASGGVVFSGRPGRGKKMAARRPPGGAGRGCKKGGGTMTAH